MEVKAESERLLPHLRLASERKGWLGKKKEKGSPSYLSSKGLPRPPFSVLQYCETYLSGVPLENFFFFFFFFRSFSCTQHIDVHIDCTLYTTHIHTAHIHSHSFEVLSFCSYFLFLLGISFSFPKTNVSFFSRALRQSFRRVDSFRCRTTKRMFRNICSWRLHPEADENMSFPPLVDSLNFI